MLSFKVTKLKFLNNKVESLQSVIVRHEGGDGLNSERSRYESDFYKH